MVIFLRTILSQEQATGCHGDELSIILWHGMSMKYCHDCKIYQITNLAADALVLPRATRNNVQILGCVTSYPHYGHWSDWFLANVTRSCFVVHRCHFHRRHLRLPRCPWIDRFGSREEVYFVHWKQTLITLNLFQKCHHLDFIVLWSLLIIPVIVLLMTPQLPSAIIILVAMTTFSCTLLLLMIVALPLREDSRYRRW